MYIAVTVQFRQLQSRSTLYNSMPRITSEWTACGKLRKTLTLEYNGKILWCAPWKLNTALINHKRYIRTEFLKI